MFPYYGGKGHLARFYSPPKYPTIIEPFAGSAKYSLLHADREVHLLDSYAVIASVWRWLIGVATRDDILALPVIPPGDPIPSIIPIEAGWFLSFISNQSTPRPKRTAGKFGWEGGRRPRLIQRAADGLHRVKHWHVENADYHASPNLEATWFIDPPYQQGGKSYPESSIDYEELRNFCLSRRGQVIVCEREGADWLPFRDLRVSRGQRDRSKSTRMEVVWESHQP